MVDRAAIFAELTKRNALRRANGLPLLDLHDEFEHAVSLVLWDEAWEQHAEELGRIRAEVTAEYGHFQSTAGRMFLGSKFMERAYVLRAGYGVYPPTPRHSIRYGEDTNHAAEVRARCKQRAVQHAEKLAVRSRIAELLMLRSAGLGLVEDCSLGGLAATSYAVPAVPLPLASISLTYSRIACSISAPNSSAFSGVHPASCATSSSRVPMCRITSSRCSIFDYVHGQSLGGLPCVIKDSLQIGRQRISHAADVSI